MTSKQFPINKNLFTSLIKTTIFSPIFIVIVFVSLFIFTSEMALAEEAINEVSSPFKNW
uniref:Uncharacterized protein n=1 Tax=Meloidogyne enterolobii TaxID=390850 RepID=A0A6V7WD44_MELEN|nr:unnamed protein product [Meloidogyne enterolobii]